MDLDTIAITQQRISEFREFVRIHWDGENLADAFVCYGDCPPLHLALMQALREEILFRRDIAE